LWHFLPVDTVKLIKKRGGAVLSRAAHVGEGNASGMGPGQSVQFFFPEEENNLCF
jgi:hypothetical protein